MKFLILNTPNFVFPKQNLQISSWFKFNLALFGIYCTNEILLYLYKWYIKWRQSKVINEVLFTNDKICCEFRPWKKVDCHKKYCYYYTVRRMESFIDGARHSIYLCMNIFTSEDLGRAILRAHERGIRIKILANRTTAYATGSQMAILHRSGIHIKFQNTQNFLHHKFCLIDSDIPNMLKFKMKFRRQLQDQPKGACVIPSNGVVLTGSMNWTFQAMNGNWENVLINSDTFLVNNFRQEFSQIWNHRYIVDFD